MSRMDVDAGVRKHGGDLTVDIPSSGRRLAHPFISASTDQKVSVTLTLSANAAEDIGGVISAIADLLKIAVPPTYEITRSPSPETFKLNLTRELLERVSRAVHFVVERGRLAELCVCVVL